MPKRIRSKIARGSADLAILSLLAEKPLYGFEIARQICERTGGALKFTLASLYPLLYEMEKRGWVEAHWQANAAGRDRRYYRLTQTGRRQLALSREEWRSFVHARPATRDTRRHRGGISHSPGRDVRARFIERTDPRRCNQNRFARSGRLARSGHRNRFSTMQGGPHEPPNEELLVARFDYSLGSKRIFGSNSVCGSATATGLGWQHGGDFLLAVAREPSHLWRRRCLPDTQGGGTNFDAPCRMPFSSPCHARRDVPAPALGPRRLSSLPLDALRTWLDQLGRNSSRSPAPRRPALPARK